MEEGPGEPSPAPPPPAALLRLIDDFLRLKRCLSAVLPGPATVGDELEAVAWIVAVVTWVMTGGLLLQPTFLRTNPYY